MSHIKLDTYIDYLRSLLLNENKLTWQDTNQADQNAISNESKTNQKQLPKTQLHGLCIKCKAVPDVANYLNTVSTFLRKFKF